MKNLLPATEHEITAELCRKSFFEFVKEFWEIIIPEIPVYNWHIPYICQELEQYAWQVIKRLPKQSDLIINIPPGTTKSTLCTIMFPAWIWTIDPTIRVLTGSYSAALATDHAVKSRDIIRSEKYRLLFPEITIKKDQDNKTHYQNTQQGERYATSVGGTVTGFHAHIIIIDDPINPKGAASDLERQKANKWMDITLTTRKVDKEMTPTILIMQRLHEMDCTGNWLKKRAGIKHICLPGRKSKDIKPRHLARNYIRGKLDPIRLSHRSLKELQTILGSYGFAGQIQQTPAPENGGIWKHWFQPLHDTIFPKSLIQEGTDWDLAYTDKDTNSACAYVTAGKLGPNMYIKDLGFEWLEFPELINYIKTRKSPHYIESKASGKSAKQSLTKMGIPAIEVAVEGGDKLARARLASPYAEAGMIFIKASLLDKLLNDERQGILKFPNNTHDDLNDALVQAINRLLIKGFELIMN